MGDGRAHDDSGSKHCVICGVDCTDKPRLRDASGRYYCKPCHAIALAEKVQRGIDQVRGEAATYSLIDEIAEPPTESLTTLPCPICGARFLPGAQECSGCGADLRRR